MDQEYGTCVTPDGGAFAYSIAGSGTPLVIIPRWMSHLELDWQRLKEWMEILASHFQVIRYDKRGTGLSNRQVTDYSLDAQLSDFELLVKHLQLRQFFLYTSSAGGLVAMSYAAMHPDKVQRLVLYSTFARGEGLTGRRETTGALASLVRAEWGLASETLTDLFMPGATTEEKDAFSVRQRLFAEPEVAARYLEEIVSVDVRPQLPRIKAPTLVVHARDDRTVPFQYGIEVASSIPNADLLVLESSRHLLPPHLEGKLWQAALDFLLQSQPKTASNATRQPYPDGLSEREVDVLKLIAAGKTNQQIASELFISLNTVSHHVANIFSKTGLSNRTQVASYAYQKRLVP